MKISPDGSSFSTSGDVDSMSERSLQNNNDSGVQRAPSDETAFQKQMFVKLEEIAAKFSEDRAGKESELARCVVELAQANERLTGQENNPSLQFARQASGESTVNLAMEGLTARVTDLEESLHASKEGDEVKQRVITLEQEKSDLVLSSLTGLTARLTSVEESLQLACQERDELKHSVITLEQEKSDFLMELSRFKEETRQDSVKVKKVFEAAVASINLASKARDEIKQSVITLKQENSDYIGDVTRLEKKCAQLKSKLTDVKNDCGPQGRGSTTLCTGSRGAADITVRLGELPGRVCQWSSFRRASRMSANDFGGPQMEHLCRRR
jgi:chromosome segregation ATPase